MPARDVLDELSHKVIGASIEVHRLLGPGLLESIYLECLESELSEQGIRVKREVSIPLNYKGKVLSKSLRLDLLLEDCLVVEAKSVDNFKLYTSSNSKLPINDILCIAKDNAGNMWFGSNGRGLIKYKIWKDN